MPITTQPLNEDERKLVEEVYTRLRIWRDGYTEIHDRAKIARDIVLLNDPYQDPPNTKPEHKILQMQTLKSTFNNCVADQMDNVMEAKMLPELPQFQELVDDINDVVGYIYELNNYPQLYRMRVQDYLSTGTAITQIMWDADMNGGKGDVAFIRVPVEQFLWDPAEANIQDSRAVMKVSWHPLSWYKSHYPSVAEYINCDEHSADAVGEQKNQEELGADEAKAMLVEYWWRTYDDETHRHEINVAYCAGGCLLYKSEKVYAHGLYPFVLDVYTEIEGLPVGEGLVMELAPMMRYVNRYAHYMDINIRAAAKIRLLVNRAAGIDTRDLANWDNDIIGGDRIDEQAVRFMQSPPLTNLALNQMYQMQTDIKQDSGQNQFTRGETTGGVTAATAISALQEAGGKQARMRTETLKFGFKRIIEQVLWLIREFYDDNRVILITGRDENVQPSQRVVDARAARLMGREHGSVPPPPYTVRIQVQRRSPNAISDQNNLIIDAYKMSAEGGQMFPLSALFRLLNIDAKDRMLPVIESVENYTETLNATLRQNQQLTETVQQQAQQMQQQAQTIEALKQTLLKQAQERLNTSQRSAAVAQPTGMPTGAFTG